MIARNVWGVIIIVVGVLIVLGAAKDYSDMTSAQEGMRRIVGRNFDYPTGLKKVFEKEIAKDIIGVLLGISMSIGGTLILKEKSNSKKQNNNKEYESFKNKVQTKEAGDEVDIAIK